MSGTIEFVRGDAHTARFALRSGGSPLLLGANDAGRLHVYDGQNRVIAKTFGSADQITDTQSDDCGVVSVLFEPGDTEGLCPAASPGSRVYLSYELELMLGGAPATPLLNSALVLLVDRITPAERS